MGLHAKRSNSENVDMKVLKFGGTSVGSVESILSVKKIVEAEKEPVVHWAELPTS